MLGEAKAAKRSTISEAHKASLDAGIEAMPVAYPGKFLPIKENALVKFMLALQRAEAANQSTVALYTIDDELLPDVSFSSAKAGFVACFDAAAALDARYRTLLKAIDLATSIEELEAVTW